MITPGGESIPYATLNAQLSATYGGCSCHQAAPVPSLASDTELDEIIEKVIMTVWRKKGMPKRLTEDLVKHYAEALWQAITEGYGDDLLTIDTDTPDEVMLQKLQASVWHFSAAKNYSELQAISEALIGPDGKLREFTDFKREAAQIATTHRGAWLRAEYDFAVANGQMSRQWVTIQEEKELIPNLEYSAVMDGRTSITCRNLHGVVRPVDDAFWQTWYPPNHWGCRSDVYPNGDDTVTPLSEIIYPDNIPDMFKRNIAADGLAFPEGHPYYKGNPDGVKKTASRLMKKYGQ